MLLAEALLELCIALLSIELAAIDVELILLDDKDEIAVVDELSADGSLLEEKLSIELMLIVTLFDEVAELFSLLLELVEGFVMLPALLTIWLSEWLEPLLELAFSTPRLELLDSLLTLLVALLGILSCPILTLLILDVLFAPVLPLPPPQLLKEIPSIKPIEISNFDGDENACTLCCSSKPTLHKRYC